MVVPLLATKLYTPSIRTPRVPRPRLVERLNAGIHRKLSLVSAPAGFGKTMLVCEWAAQSERPVTWLSLDKGDNDPAHFWSYLVAAFQKVCDAVEALAPTTLKSPSSSSAEPVLTRLINILAEESAPFVLVLDDYHVIQSAAVHEILTFLLDHQPPQMHIVIATRVDPPLPLSRLRGRGQLTGLYQTDLRFTPGEVSEFLQEVMGLDLCPADVDALGHRTEGWVAGLQMAAISMRGHDDVTGFVRAFTGSHRYILDYLSEEVLRQQPRHVQTFLLQTAILDRLSSELCDAVIEVDGLGDDRASVSAQSILESLERNNLFVVPLDDERCWYRYHHLFADLLRQRLRIEHPELVPELHRRASQWYEQNGWVADAVGHALTSGDHAWAASLIQRAGWATFTRGEMTTILDWIATLPEDVVRSRPQLGILNAWAMAKSGQLERVEACLAAVDPSGLKGEVAAVRAYVAGVQRDFALAIELAQRAFEDLPEERIFLRAIVAQNLGVAYHWNGDPIAASRTLHQAIELSRAAGQVYQTLTALSILGRAYEMQGSLHRAQSTYQEALDLTSEPSDRPVPFAGMAYVGMAGPLYEWNDLDAAIRCATEGIRLSELGGFVVYQVFGYARLSQIYEARGERARAVDALQKADLLGRGSEYALVVALVSEWRLRLWAAQGKAASVIRWARSHRVSVSDELDAAQEVEQAAVARALIVDGRSGEALPLLARLLNIAQATGRMGRVIKLLVLQAMAFQAQDDLDGALVSLGHALSRAEPEGYVRTFVDEGAAMNQLLRDALSRGVMPNYVARILAAFRDEVRMPPPAMAALVEPLTEREVEVLRLIVAGLSNPEIADELYIAVSTVKSHVNHIFGKLEVKSRAQAMAKVRTLNLL
jgi:LuxR family maltose regulon positive regulatory protein